MRPLTLLEIKQKKIIHLCQSYYIFNFLKKKKIELIRKEEIKNMEKKIQNGTNNKPRSIFNHTEVLSRESTINGIKNSSNKQ